MSEGGATLGLLGLRETNHGFEMNSTVLDFNIKFYKMC